MRKELGYNRINYFLIYKGNRIQRKLKRKEKKKQDLYKSHSRRLRSVLKSYYQVSKKWINRGINETLFKLEHRLDVVLVRVGFTHSIRESRQMISHGYIWVNECKIQKPGYLLKAGDLFQIKSKEWGLKIHGKTKFIYGIPKYLHVNYKIATGIFIRNPKDKEIFFPLYKQYSPIVRLMK